LSLVLKLINNLLVVHSGKPQVKTNYYLPALLTNKNYLKLFVVITRYTVKDIRSILKANLN